MHNRSSEFTPPHTRAASVVRRYLEELMSLTYKHPILMRDLVYVAGASSLALLTSPLWSSSFGYVSAAAGAAGSLVSLASGLAQHKVYGFPTTDIASTYQPSQFQFRTATAELVVNRNEMPILHIKSNDHFDAGYVEGFVLGEAIRANIERVDVISPLLSIAMAMGLRESLALVLRKIPAKFQREMQGKVAGYNEWLRLNHPQETQLNLEHYLFLHLLPDIKNYEPLDADEITTRLNAGIRGLTPQMGCTTIAARLGEYTFFTRVLDWPSYGAAGKYFLQIDRNIAGSKRTIDIGIPVLSGALTILNENGLLIEMNVANGEKVKTPEGMPAVFFNRYCAENASNLEQLRDLLSREKPLGAYHLTASDGKETESFHFYQSELVQGENAVDTLEPDKKSPQLLVVANNGLRFENGVPVKINHSDSNERRQNIHQLFHHKPVLDKLSQSIRSQENGQPLSQNEIVELQQLFLQMARLPLVNNCESVLCAMYVYHENQLQDARAVTDNLFAQTKELEEFKRLSFPR